MSLHHYRHRVTAENIVGTVSYTTSPGKAVHTPSGVFDNIQKFRVHVKASCKKDDF